jgi:phospholipase C
MCGTPGYDKDKATAYLNNHEYPDYGLGIIGQLPWRSIFQQLDEKQKSWKVYYDDDLPIAAIIKYVFDRLAKHQNVEPFDQTFFDDVDSGQLPAFSLIEPRYQDWVGPYEYAAPTSNHPGSSSATSRSGVPISISCGERMLARVFRALVANPDLFETTLLIVTYDEHGGLFDHVTPESAVSPFTTPVKGYDYRTYGVRVPTLFINPHVKQGLFPSDSSISLDHTSLLATLRDQWNLDDSLSPRVKQAHTLKGLIPGEQPIVPPAIPEPQCVWSPPPTTDHPGKPIVATLLWRGLLAVRGSDTMDVAETMRPED